MTDSDDYIPAVPELPIITFAQFCRSAERAFGDTPTELEYIAETGYTPLEHILSVYRNPAQDPRDRLAAAIKALPYAHKTLAEQDEANRRISPDDLLGGLDLSALGDDEVSEFMRLSTKLLSNQKLLDNDAAE